MSKKFAIISLLFITASITFLSCNSYTTSKAAVNDHKSVETSTSDLAENDISESFDNSTIESNDTVNSKNYKSNNIQSIQTINTTSIQNTESTVKQDNKSEINTTTNNVKEKNSITYISQAGFSMTFPSNWEDKYTIEENSNEVCVAFKSNDPENKDYNSWMISIRKSDTDDIPCFGLAVGNIQNFNSNGSHYIVFMPNDLTLDCRRSDYNEYLSMMAECESVINSITIIK